VFPRLPEDDYAELCHQVLGRDGWACRHCKFRGSLHVHHIIFRSEGGPDELWNLITLCTWCHDAVHRGYLELLIDDEITFRINGDWRPGQ